MTHVKAPNGDIYDLVPAVASGLVNSADRGWEYVDAPSEGKPAGNASLPSWVAYAETLGIPVTDEDGKPLTRDAIKDAVTAAENDPAAEQ